MKKYIRSTDDKLQKAVSVANAIYEKKIGHAGYPETYGECRVLDHGVWRKGKFTDSARDGSWFRVRTWGAGVGAYTERNYPVEDIEFV